MDFLEIVLPVQEHPNHSNAEDYGCNDVWNNLRILRESNERGLTGCSPSLRCKFSLAQDEDNESQASSGKQGPQPIDPPVDFF